MNHIRTLLSAAALLSLAARADGQTSPPSNSNSTTPACIRVIQSNGTSAAAAFGQFEVVVRDLANNPVTNASVVVDLSAIPEVALATDQLDPGVLVDCGAATVRRVTDVNGRVVFSIVGGGRAGIPASALIGAGKIFANGTQLASPTVSAFDLDGQQGLGAGDLAQFLNDFASGVNFGRSDFDCSNSVGAGDLAQWLRAFSSGTQIVSAPSCP